MVYTGFLRICHLRIRTFSVYLAISNTLVHLLDTIVKGHLRFQDSKTPAKLYSSNMSLRSPVEKKGGATMNTRQRALLSGVLNR